MRLCRNLYLLAAIGACMVGNVRLLAGAATSRCNVYARTDAGWVCGLRRWAESGTQYASFRGVPYAKQPLGDLRFQELQPTEPWDDLLDASEEGPVCPQTDVFYGRLMQPRASGEACIHANVHVPLYALPEPTQQRLARQLEPPYRAAQPDIEEQQNTDTGVPILVFIHGGGFCFGSGDADLHGPEYLVSKGVIVITFNYRLGPFGFLSLNSSSVPGNNGLRDMITLLRWVQTNARAFGGDPARVTLAGQSAGSAAAHLLTLSNAAQGLFSRTIMMSGTGSRSFYSTSPAYAQFVASQFLEQLGIHSNDPEEVHRQLIEISLEKIMEANAILLDQIGLTTFVPVIESSHPGVTMILDDDPEQLIAKGRGAEVPLLIGFTNQECETFRPRFKEIDIVARLKQNPILTLSPSLIYKNSIEKSMSLASDVEKRYFNGNLTLDNYVKLCSDEYFKYSSLKVAEERARRVGGAPVFLYQFSYSGTHAIFRDTHGLPYGGAGHVDDLTYLFRVNSVLGAHRTFPPTDTDDRMKDWLSTLFVNFIKFSDPTGEENRDYKWLPMRDHIVYQNIEDPYMFHSTRLTPSQCQLMTFFDKIWSK